MYKCCRCNYETSHKGSMVNHFKRKKPCPNLNNIEMTDEIKQKILDNRIYHIPSVQYPPTTINNIHIYNTILKLEPDVKIDLLMEYLNIDMEGIYDSKHFNRMRKHMLSYKDKEDEHETVNCHHIEDLFKEIILFLKSFFDENEPTKNMYNCFIKSNIFHMFDGYCWEKDTVPSGLKQLIHTMKNMIFDAYEICLIRQLLFIQKRCKAKEMLKEYYAFILSFDNIPTFLEERNNDNKLLYNKNEPKYNDEPAYVIIDELYQIWTIVGKEMKEYKKSSNKKTLKQIVNNHSYKTLRILDKIILSKCSEDIAFHNSISSNE